MKRLLVAIIVLCMGMGLLVGCSSNDTQPVEPSVSEEKVEMTGTLEPVEDLHEGERRNILTGEWMEEAAASHRPLAVMMGNTTAALPQHGIGQAGVVYESPVEGGLTRIMAVIYDYQNVEKIMSIRSCRHYFVHWALEYNALYAHYGQAKYALDILGQSYVHNLSGLESSVENVMYKRDDSRSAPHNAYTTGELVLKGIEVKGYETALDSDYDRHFLFAEDEEPVVLTEGQDALLIKPGYVINKPWFEYNEEDGLYYRFQYGNKHIDGIDNSQLSCKNIILQVSSVSVIDDKYGYLDVETVGSGNGYYVTNGKMIPITWSKDSVTAPTYYYKEDGTELTLNVGKTWICIVDDAAEDDIVIQGEVSETE